MCLSVTKWIHLNGGDAALKSFFRKLYSSLTPGVSLLTYTPSYTYNIRYLPTD